MKKVLITFLTVFVLAFVSALVVGFLYNLLVHGTSVLDWENAFRLGIILGVVFAWLDNRKKA